MLVTFPENCDLFVRNLCWLRKKYALPQKTLAALTGISLPILRMTERGEVIPRLTEEFVRRLCQIFDLSADQLMNTDLTQ